MGIETTLVVTIIGLIIGGVLTVIFWMTYDGLERSWDEYSSFRCMIGRHAFNPKSVWSYRMTEGRIGTNATCVRCKHTIAKIRYASN